MDPAALVRMAQAGDEEARRGVEVLAADRDNAKAKEAVARWNRARQGSSAVYYRE